ncbi:ribonucleoside triphosphate reductase [Lachnospiraceae bacterium C1.1]|nr:ribonucleoside triphosphate reductase [Lachnospiraceae bacterium C1.1]
MTSIKTIVKRNKQKVKFDSSKIRYAIEKALMATGEKHSILVLGEMERMAVETLERENVDAEGNVTVEEAQDAAEKALMAKGFYDSAIAFDRYRVVHTNVRNILNKVDWSKKVMEGYVGEPVPTDNDITDFSQSATVDKDKQSWRVKQNASVSYSIGGNVLNNSALITEEYWLDQVYDPEIADAHRTKKIHIHDLGWFGAYCGGWNLKTLIERGISGVPGKITSAPAKHLMTICNQMVNFLGIMQNEWAGAQAFSSFDTYLAPFIKVDNLSYREVKQAIQSFIYGINTPSRWGSQAPFSNITLDWTCPEDLAVQKAIVGGKEQDFTYGDCVEEMAMINKAFLETMIEGDADGRGFAYPIPTYSITREFDWNDSENNRLLFEMAAKYGTPYFSNYINSDMKPSDVRSMCCRLRLDLRELRKQNGGNFGAGENTGSIGVVTVNLPQIAYLSDSEDEFFNLLSRTMDIAARSLDIKRKVITAYYDAGLYPYTRAYLPNGFKDHFSTIGLVGMNETTLNARWIGRDLTDPKSLAWANKVLDFMREKLSDYQEKYGNLFNLEATPAESTAYRFARYDSENFADIITAGKPGETPYYTNSTHLPVNAVEDVFDALDMEDELQTKYTSGTVFHCFLGERISDWQSAAALVKEIAENYKLPYFTLSPTYSVCEEHGYINGEVSTCPKCGKKTEIYSRITGYYRPVSNWNAGKAQEFEDRKTYSGFKKISDYKLLSSDKKNSGKKDTTKSSSENIIDTILSDDFEVRILATHTCPKCRAVEAQMDDKGINYKTIYAENSDGQKLAEANNIMSVPVLFIGDKMISDYSKILSCIGAMK